MTRIKNIIFDYGGVFLLLDEAKTYKAFKELGLHVISDELTKNNHNFQRGKISAEQFIENIKSELPQQVTSEQIKDAWCAMLGQLPNERVQLLRQLKKDHNIYLLSNTDAMHIERVGQTVSNVNEFLGLFDKIYYSHDTGFRKPEREIYDLVIRENNLDPTHTLFIDDVRENAEAAARCGLNYFWLDLSKYTVLDMPSILKLF